METFDEEQVKVPFGTKVLDAALCVPASVKDVHSAVILTHGAGGDMNYKHLVSLAHALASNGFICLRFTCKGLNLSYRVKAYCAVWDYLKTFQESLTMETFDEAGQTHIHHQRSKDLRMLPERLRVLFVSGTEDNMCDRELFSGVLKDMKAQTEVFWIEGGSHGLTVKGKSEDSVMDQINLKVINWIKNKEFK
uniref:Testis expressed 30 n=1 Tax=Iconisemion striatum TaxID=60296 RepID=A0A1A7YBF1_9TELE